MAGWLDQVGIRLTQLSTGLKVEAELGNTRSANDRVKTFKCRTRRFERSSLPYMAKLLNNQK